MLGLGKSASSSKLKDDKKKKEKKVVDKDCAKKIKGFHLGREPVIFPGVHIDINDHEMCDLLSELDHTFN